MVKSVQRAEINSFVKGLISEASPLNFPPDAERDGENFELNKDGSRDRRFGIDFETNAAFISSSETPTNLSSKNINSYRWFNAGGEANNEFGVVQIGSRIFVFDINKASISSLGYIGSVTISGVTGAELFRFASVEGTLIIAAGTPSIHFVKWDGTSLTYSTNRLLVRDQWGVPDGLEGNDINKRPSTLSAAHLYNLTNQGWGIPRKNAGGTLDDPIDIVFSGIGKYPSNSDTVYLGLQVRPVASGTPYERLFPDLFDDSLGLDSLAAKGYFIIDVLNRGTSRRTVYNNNRNKFPILSRALGTIPTDSTSGGAKVVADFAGRAFYAGFDGEITDGSSNSPVLNSYVLFSQLSSGTDDLVKCYQRGDPTSREVADLVDTDGGVIRISGARQIVGMFPISESLFVVAENGVWRIKGGSDYGFSATNYEVSKLSNYGCNCPNSLVLVGDKAFFWSDIGIFAIQRNEFGDWVVSNISEGTIQSLYDEIPSDHKEACHGVYDAFDKKVRWMYNRSSDPNSTEQVQELLLDLVLGSFHKVRIYNLSTNSPKIIGYLPSTSFEISDNEEIVVAGADTVVVGADNVIVMNAFRDAGVQAVKYITVHGVNGSNHTLFSFSQYKNSSFADWESVDNVGVDAFAFLETGDSPMGDSAVFKQAPYIVMHFRKTESGVVLEEGQLVPNNRSSCLIQTQWDWSNSANSFKWSDYLQVYRYRKPLFITGPLDPYDNGFEVITSKNKIRGRGRALGLRITTEPRRDCRILGWNLSVTGNSLA